jgi:aryl-alcohol dehydrogenase-like predicted oxidoreductase
MLAAYASAGGNLSDTADAYSGGESETNHRQVDGRSRQPLRHRAVATKVGTHPQYKGLTPATIKADAEETLRRLGSQECGHRVGAFRCRPPCPEEPRMN